jgi:nucleotide-binding universal stress UspA family protein
LKPKVVIGFDGREAGDDALALGGDLCRMLDAQPLVLSVAPWPRFMHGENLQVALEIDTGEDLARAAERLADLDPVTKAVAHRSVAEEIGLVARSEGAVAIVIGACHRGAFGKVLLGSVGRSLLHGAPCAVAVAPIGYRRRTDADRDSIAVAFDGSPESWAALDTGIFLAKTSEAELGILTVAGTDFYMADAAWPAVGIGEMAEREREYAQQLLDEASSRVPGDVRATTHLMQGSPCELLGEASREYGLMILGSRGHGPMGRTVLGSVSGCLMDEARCPVIVLPRGSKLMRQGLVEAGSAASATR